MEKIISAEDLKFESYQNAIAGLKNFPLTAPFLLKKICFFDIETTGLSAAVSSVYLIGCGEIKEDKLLITQWFADDYGSEKDLLLAFSEYILNFDVLIHYNGTSFDIPYLERKYNTHHVCSPFDSIESIDVYKLIRPYKKWFSLPNLKLTTIEHFLSISRNDRFTGKDCIELYSNYMQMKYFCDNEKKEACYYALLLHNHDDISGTLLCCQLLLYLLPFTSEHLCFHVVSEENDYANIEVTLPGILPAALRQDDEIPYFAYKNNKFRVRIPIDRGEHFYFFPDYKNYYYLPLEDQAIHKSVSSFVDAAHRKNATSKNCYTKKTGTFLPIERFKKSSTDFYKYPLFFDREKHHAYIEWQPSDETFCHEILPKYLENLIVNRKTGG